MKRTASIIAAALMMVGASAGAASASAAGDGSDYGTQPGYLVAGDCGTMHGSFNAFGKSSNMGEGNTDGVLGANGPATGDNNSAKNCQRNL